MQAGFLPPIAAGFDEFIKADPIADASRRIIHAAEVEGQTDVFDTHPSLHDRLAALGAGANLDAIAHDGKPASTLIGDLDTHARALLEFTFGREVTDKLKPIDWTIVGESVFAKRWREIAKSHAQWLSRFTADSLPIGKHAFIRLGSDLVRSDEQNVNSDVRIARAVNLLAVALGVRLLDRGWRAVTGPGMPVVLVRGSETFDPFAAMHSLSAGLTTPDRWEADCQTLDLTGIPLGEASEKPVALIR